MKHEISEILPYLFLGSYQDSLNNAVLTELGITHILNVLESSKYYEDKTFIRKHISVSDFGDSNLAELIAKCCLFIDDAKASDGKVFLHCRRGQNRSPSIATGYLMKSTGLTLNQAFHHVRTRRTQFAPHELYLKQLQDLEISIFGSLSLTEEKEPLSIQAISREIVQSMKDGK